MAGLPVIERNLEEKFTSRKEGIRMEFYHYINTLEKDKNYYIATVVQGIGMGEKAVFLDGEIVYSTGDMDLWKRAVSQFQVGDSLIEADDRWIYIERLQEDYKVVICGAGHISIPLIKISKMMGLNVTVIEDRPQFANNARIAGADLVLCDDFENALKQIPGDASTFFVIVTRGHRHDQVCLENIIQKENRYIGMIGSKVRVRMVKEALVEKGIDRRKLDEIYSPIGLDIKAETPVEIAIAIMGEIVLKKNSVQAGSGYSRQMLKYLDSEEYKDLPKALVTIVARKGSAPRGVGTKMLVLKDGTIIDTIGGGCVEAEARQKAIQCMNDGKPSLTNVDMTGNDADEGMVCGGIISLFIEPVI